MKILGIDTSCDDTSLAIIEIKDSRLKILINIVSSQTNIHRKYGGVYPFLAQREHQKNLPIIWKKINQKIDVKDIDLIGVTIGPGLDPCLWQGINFAVKTGKKLNLPIVRINHVEAHLFSSFINKNFKDLFSAQKILPAIGLIVSGGHTELIFIKEFFKKYKVIGQTRDDAAGECLDKTARILGLGYPGGPIIEKMSQNKICQRRRQRNILVKLPRPMLNQKNYDFSFSGLKTAVWYDLKDRKLNSKDKKIYKVKMAKEIQDAVIEVLIQKTFRAVKDFGAKSIILGGGVVANKKLKRDFKNGSLIRVFSPQKDFCTDNGAMVALTAFFYRNKATFDYKKVISEPGLEI